MKPRPYRIVITGPYYGMYKDIADVELSQSEALALSLVLESLPSMLLDAEKKEELELQLKNLAEVLSRNGA